MNIKLEKFNLQMFNDEEVPLVDPVLPVDEEVPPVDPVPRTFNQEELETIIKKEKAKLKKNMLTPEERKEYEEYKNANKTDIERREELDTENAKKITDLSSKVAIYETKDKLHQSQVDSQYVEFVAYEVNKKVNDDNSFDEVLEEYKKNNPQYFKIDNNNPDPNLTTGKPHKQFNEPGKEPGFVAILRKQGKLK